MSHFLHGPGAPYLLRSWTSNDAGSDREISQAIYPEYREESGHPAWFPAQQLGAPCECSSRYVVAETRNEQRVAFAALWELRRRRYRFDLAVRPEWQGQGLATQLLSQVINDAQAFGATGLQARVRDDKTEALAFVRRRGFVESHRMAAYRLDIAPGMFDSPERAGAELRESGIEVTSLAEIRQRHGHAVDRLYALYSAACEGWPDPDPDPNGPVSMPLEKFRGWLDEWRQPEAILVAMHQQRYVAFTSFFDTGTAVDPEYRCKGIATLLKSLSIADARRRGLRGQTTSTANPAMARVLEKLGYRRSWSEVRLLRELVP